MEFAMRLTALLIATCLPTAALAQDTAGSTAPGLVPGIYFNSSISINLPLTAADRAGKTAEEDAYRLSLYERALKECDALTTTVAKSCEITAVNVSTQVNANPGQPDYLYATASITMQVDLK
jgi:hypothetical protein